MLKGSRAPHSTHPSHSSSHHPLSLAFFSILGVVTAVIFRTSFIPPIEISEASLKDSLALCKYDPYDAVPLRSSTPSNFGEIENYDDTLSLKNLYFGISTNARDWPKRRDFLRSWWNASLLRGSVFLDEIPPGVQQGEGDPTLRIIRKDDVISMSLLQATKGAPPPSIDDVIRLRTVLDTLENVFGDRTDDAPMADQVKWFVFAQEDTFFSLPSLLATLSKYPTAPLPLFPSPFPPYSLSPPLETSAPPRYYVGGTSELHSMNVVKGNRVSYSGGGFAISNELGRALHSAMKTVLTGTLSQREDANVKLSEVFHELGAIFIEEKGFHATHIYRDLSGFLNAHPPHPFVSLHLHETVSPIFSNVQLEDTPGKFLELSRHDPIGFLQHSVCYYNEGLANSSVRMGANTQGEVVWTASIAWGYSVKIYFKGVPISVLNRAEFTFDPRLDKGELRFDVRDVVSTDESEPCGMPFSFFVERVVRLPDGRVASFYVRKNDKFSLDERKSCRLKVCQIDGLWVVRKQALTRTILNGGFDAEMRFRWTKDDAVQFGANLPPNILNEGLVEGKTSELLKATLPKECCRETLIQFKPADAFLQAISAGREAEDLGFIFLDSCIQ